MKHLKQILVVAFALLSLTFSVKVSYAGEDYAIDDMQATSKQTISIKFNKSLNLGETGLTSDLKVYKDVSVSKAERDALDDKKVIISLEDELTQDSSYSILSISGVDGSIEFALQSNISGTDASNSLLEESEQGIASISVIDSKTIEAVFAQNITTQDFDFKVYKNTKIEATKLMGESELAVLLNDNLEDNSDYVGTVTIVSGEDDKKVDIDSGIFDFSTQILAENDNSISFGEDSSDSEVSEKSLEEQLLESLESSKDLNSDILLDSEREIINALNSASEDPENTQLEELALGTSETPDTGAETWVLILATLIINTFYFMTRARAVKTA